MKIGRPPFQATKQYLNNTEEGAVTDNLHVVFCHNK